MTPSSQPPGPRVRIVQLDGATLAALADSDLGRARTTTPVELTDWLVSPVGEAGFHAAPDADGMVEIGYAIDPEQRRRGYARAVLEHLLERARHEPDVRTFRATVSPTNAPSLALIGQYPFVEVGEQWDDEDGLEIIYEILVG